MEATETRDAGKGQVPLDSLAIMILQMCIAHAQVSILEHWSREKAKETTKTGMGCGRMAEEDSKRPQLRSQLCHLLAV